jgi:hypothetical protein
MCSATSIEQKVLPKPEKVKIFEKGSNKSKLIAHSARS